MAKPTQRTDTAIDKLLQDRAQFISWITRLTGPSGSSPAVPEAVRQRVRGDYEQRLQSVVEALRSHQADLEQQMSEFAARREALSSRESEAKERLAEAEVRHMVGEYDDGRWQTIRADLTREVVSVQEELSRTVAEIDRLEEVLTTIRSPIPSMEPEPEPAPPPVAAVAEPPRPAPSPVAPIPGIMTEFTAPQSDQRPPAVATQGNEIPFKTPAAPKPQPKPPAAKPKEDAAGRTLWFPSGKPGEAPAGKMDELAFLKSVTGNEGGVAPAQPAKRPSGGFTKPAETSAPPAAAAPPASAVEAPKDRPSAGGAPKTLKCGECGTMNRPTEWYCERCGAELAAL
jgi:hypothetical protein